MTQAVLAVDPGKLTGVVLLEWNVGDEVPQQKLSVEVDEVNFFTTVDIALTGWKNYEKFAVVCERFTITAQTVRNSQAPFSLEQIGVLKHTCRMRGYKAEDIKFQAPVDAKTMFPNDRIKKVGIWHKGGEGHALDATRHALLYLVKQGWKPKVLLN